MDDVPPPERVPSWWESLLRYGWVVLVPLIVIALVALLEGGGGDRSTVGGARMALFDLRVGDCFDAPGTAITRSQVEGRACTESHRYEVLAVVAYPVDRADAYPGEEALADYVGSECEIAFEDYVGIPAARSVYLIEYWIPTPDAWEAGDRRSVCAAVHPDEPSLDTSIRGSRR